jgi:3-phenylpropionate/trans-cinnamate dioxygenase ferredoxin reductase subunit
MSTGTIAFGGGEPLIGIVGGGLAGISAAHALRELGFAGQVTVFASEACEAYERPALSKAFLTDHETAGPPSVYGADVLRDARIHLELDTPVAAIDTAERTLTTAARDKVRYAALLLATGARCRRLQIPGSDLAGVHYLRELADARRLRALLQPGRRIVVVGGGVIGLEVAASAVHRGCEVAVVEAGPQLMGRVVPAELAGTVADVHRARGVRIHIGVRPEAFLGTADGVRAVALSDGSLIAADGVLVGIGVLPRTELAERAGIAVDDGIVVDEHFRTSDEHVFAAGDVARVFHARERRHLRTESWRAAGAQGRGAAASMLARGEPYRDVPWMWSDQHDAHIQTVGFGFYDAKLVPRGGLDEPAGLTYFAVRGDELVGAYGMSLGAGVGKTIRVAQLVMERGLPVDRDRLRDHRQDIKALLRPGAQHTALAGGRS